VRIQLLSDGHDDIPRNRIDSLPDAGADVVVCAGDLMQPGHHALRRFRELFRNSTAHLIYVAGNHDYYSYFDPKRPDSGTRTTIEEQRFHLMPRCAAEEGIIFIDDGEIEITNAAGESAVFIGGTGWTDFRCSPAWMSRADVLREAGKRMNDYRVIKCGEGRSRDRITPEDTLAMHRESVEFIAQRLQANAAEGKDCVVITHHAPSPRSLPSWDPAKPGIFNQLDGCYASDLEYLMHGDAAPRLWCHGHIHSSLDYAVGNCRVVANARGYCERDVRENPNFDPALVLEIEHRYQPTMRI
jgi:Calcineurin-like phosphoesterase